MTSRVTCFAVAGLCLAVVLAGCGRKGDLETPTASSSTPSVETAASPVDPALAVQAEIEEPEENKGFFLDPLIGAE